MNEFDFIVIGGGMAGASAGYFLAGAGRVLVLEMESQPGYHTTGRSAALYSEVYGNAVIRGLTSGSRGFYTDPPDGFCEHPLLTPRGAMFVGRADQLDTLATIAAEGSALVDSVRLIDGAETCARVPALRPDYVAGGIVEPDAMDMDVNAIHTGFLRGLRAKGGELRCDAAVRELSRQGEHWLVDTAQGVISGGVIVNAAGAWADRIAALAGATAVGLVPKRRTVIQFDPPDGFDSEAWPLVVDADEEFYFKPDAGKLIASPADETPMAPCDVQPEELDIAVCIDRIGKAAALPVPRVDHSWAGLRSFVADKTTVVGPDPKIDGLIWCAGQGGYGIQTAPSMGRITAALATGQEVPDDLADFGVTAAALSPARFIGKSKQGRPAA
jgi:D-arginine dehydrogenase